MRANLVVYAFVQSRYNYGFIVKLMLIWRREERREIIAWLCVSTKLGTYA